MIAGYKEFEFDLPAALLSSLIDELDALASAPLDPAALSGMPDAQGVYQLFLDDNLVYIGKTDAEAGLRKRLDRHAAKVQHRANLSPNQVTFKAIRIFVFTAIDLETQLIRHYTGKQGTAWNGSGFGSNDPGRERDKSKPGKFDTWYPLQIDVDLESDLSGTMLASEAINALRAAMPHRLRVEAAVKRGRKPHPDIKSTTVTVDRGANTARKFLHDVTVQLPSGWQATALSALLILYKESDDKYPGATIIARS